VPTAAETTCCIAASYEAKRHGVKTGTMVRDARRLCPGLHVVEARPHLYIVYHRRIVEAVESCLPVGSVLSIDEMACPLAGAQRQPDRAVALARQLKETIRRDVGGELLCSVGLAPNVLLAKLAADMQKPDGLTVIRPEELPGCLHGLPLTDLPGVGGRMEQRLHRHGVTTMEHLCRLSTAQLAEVWGSRVLADRLWRRLRGEDVPDPPTRRGTVGHSRVLAPEHRNDRAARAVLVCLLHKAAARLRGMDHWCGSLGLWARFVKSPPWQTGRPFPLCRDTLTLLHYFDELWRTKPPGQPHTVGLVLAHLAAGQNVSVPLFAEERDLQNLADAMDQLNHRFGKHAVFFGGMLGMAGEDKLRIAFTQIPDY
jgi:DNA polymerase-4